MEIEIAVRGRIDKCQKANRELFNSTSHSCRILIGQLKQKPSESCQNIVANFVQLATVQHALNEMMKHYNVIYLVITLGHHFAQCFAKTLCKMVCSIIAKCQHYNTSHTT